ESSFRFLLRYLKEHTEIIAPQEIDSIVPQNRKPRVMITFDDGWADNFAVGAPVMTAHKIKACFFMVTGQAGASEPFWPEKVLGLLGTLQPERREDILQWFLSNLAGRAAPLPALAAMQQESLLTWIKQFPAAR